MCLTCEHIRQASGLGQGDLAAEGAAVELEAALTVLQVNQGQNLALTVLHVSLTVLCVALTVLYVLCLTCEL